MNESVFSKFYFVPFRTGGGFSFHDCAGRLELYRASEGTRKLQQMVFARSFQRVERSSIELFYKGMVCKKRVCETRAAARAAAAFSANSLKNEIETSPLAKKARVPRAAQRSINKKVTATLHYRRRVVLTHFKKKTDFTSFMECRVSVHVTLISKLSRH